LQRFRGIAFAAESDGQSPAILEVEKRFPSTRRPHGDDAPRLSFASSEIPRQQYETGDQRNDHASNAAKRR
jgi:hypothetical protein